jgi:protocatechuate 4,5-dioxygenase alpha chain
MSYLDNPTPIPGTYIFDGKVAAMGYNLNKMCYTFNKKESREEFLKDEMAYCDKFGLSDVQKEAIKNRDVIGLLEAGGNIYFLAKFTGILGYNMQDIGAIQTGMSVEDFKAMLVKAGE